jgi:hypothetical protein
MHALRATPPVKTTGGSSPTRRSMPAVRAAMAACRPRAMSSGGAPPAMSDTASVSANTVHMLPMGTARAPPRA